MTRIPGNLSFSQRDFEGPWRSVGLDSWDLIHMRMLNGSISSLAELYQKVYMCVGFLRTAGASLLTGPTGILNRAMAGSSTSKSTLLLAATTGPCHPTRRQRTGPRSLFVRRRLHIAHYLTTRTRAGCSSIKDSSRFRNKSSRLHSIRGPPIPT